MPYRDIEKRRESSRKHYKENIKKERERSRRYRRNNLEKVRESRRKRYREHIEKEKEYNRLHYKEHKEHYRKWKEKNLEKVRIYGRKYYKSNSEVIKERTRKWGKENPQRRYENRIKYSKKCPEKARDRSKRYNRKIRDTIKGQIDSRMSSYMYYMLKGNKAGRSWKSIVDFTPEQFKQHFQSLFTKGMTWKKFMNGEIHIDHVVPSSCFEYESTDDPQFKECWSLHNLQPMWKHDNLSKGNRRYQLPLLLYEKGNDKENK